MFGKRVGARKRVTYNRLGQPGVSHYYSIGNAAISLSGTVSDCGMLALCLALLGNEKRSVPARPVHRI